MKREEKKVFPTNKFQRRAFERCLERDDSYELFLLIATKAVKQWGKLFPHPRQQNTQKCIFLHPNGTFYTILVVEDERSFVMKSVYRSNSVEIKFLSSSEYKAFIELKQRNRRRYDEE